MKSLFGSVCHEFLLKAAADAESCCASLMEVSALNFFWKLLSMLKISVLLYKTAYERLRLSKSG